MSLERYHAKRDFKKTPEPRGHVARKKPGELSYLIQKHAASRLHYDFRLELDGVLLSWAVPKGPSLDPADKRLAMHVEDHPVEYGGFEGIIPKGQYGGGTVMIWDRGTWSPIGDAKEGYEKGHLKFELRGEKLQGRWALIRTRGRFDGKGDPWLLIKDSDEYAQRGNGQRIVEAEPNSIVSGRDLAEIAESRDREWHSDRSTEENVRAGAVAPFKRRKRKAANAVGKKTTAAPENAKRARMPATLAPTLATLVREVPAGDDWIHEIKYDGYRMLARLQDGKVELYSRNGLKWTERFPDVVRELKRVKAKAAWIDGEVCAVDTGGRTSFQALQNALSHPRGAQLVYFVFDLIYLDGFDLRGVRLVDRKRMLREVLPKSASQVQYSPEVRGAGPDVYASACKQRLEGVVSKRADSTYATGVRARTWVKTKCSRRQEMVVGGYTDPNGARSGFGALLLGFYENGQLKYSGKVGTGFDEGTLAELRRKLDRLEQREAPFVNPPRMPRAETIHWVAPELVAEIQFTEWSEAGALRHPSFVGLREDKKASDVVRENEQPLAAPSPSHDSAGAARPARGQTGATQRVAGIKLTHPEKLMFPEKQVSKLDLARYFEAVAKWMLPHVSGRPLSLVRCPDGWDKKKFFQKHANETVDPAVDRVDVPESGGRATYLAANSAAALVGLVQWGTIEMHPWGSRVPHLEKPDQLIFDLDPADDLPWARVVEAAGVLRGLLSELRLACFLKTTGGKGLHIVVPVEPALDWKQAKGFTGALAEFLARTFPDRFTAHVAKAQRTDRIFIDYLRNTEGATAIAPYGVRARRNAPVATPIAWDELKGDVRFDYFNIETVPARLSALKRDPWAGFARVRQPITAEMFRKVGATPPAEVLEAKKARGGRARAHGTRRASA